MLAQERQSQGSLTSNYSTFLTFHVKNMRKKSAFIKKTDLNSMCYLLILALQSVQLKSDLQSFSRELVMTESHWKPMKR